LKEGRKEERKIIEGRKKHKLWKEGTKDGCRRKGIEAGKEGREKGRKERRKEGRKVVSKEGRKKEREEGRR
jgi:hypothetical protein